MKKITLLFLSLVLSLNADSIYADFSVEATKNANLALTSGGIIDILYADTTEIVKKGDKLAVLKNSDLKAALKVAKANVKNAEVSLKFAKKEYERQEKIKNLINQEKFDRYTLAYESAKVALEQAKANALYKKTLLDKTTLYAPFDGIILSKNAEVGDAVSGVSLKTIFKIQSLHKRKLILKFDQKYWKDVKVGDIYKYKIDGDTKEYVGSISKIYPYANASNRKIEAEVKAKDFIVGLFGDGYIISNSIKK